MDKNNQKLNDQHNITINTAVLEYNPNYVLNLLFPEFQRPFELSIETDSKSKTGIENFRSLIKILKKRAALNQTIIKKNLRRLKTSDILDNAVLSLAARVLPIRIDKELKSFNNFFNINNTVISKKLLEIQLELDSFKEYDRKLDEWIILSIKYINVCHNIFRQGLDCISIMLRKYIRINNLAIIINNSLVLSDKITSCKSLVKNTFENTKNTFLIESNKVKVRHNAKVQLFLEKNKKRLQDIVNEELSKIYDEAKLELKTCENVKEMEVSRIKQQIENQKYQDNEEKILCECADLKYMLNDLPKQFSVKREAIKSRTINKIIMFKRALDDSMKSLLKKSCRNMSVALQKTIFYILREHFILYQQGSIDAIEELFLVFDDKMKKDLGKLNLKFKERSKILKLQKSKKDKRRKRILIFVSLVGVSLLGLLLYYSYYVALTTKKILVN